MNDENNFKIVSSFPKLYPKLHPLRPMRGTPFFFECRDGWFQLLWDLSVKLEAEIIKSSGFTEPPVVQVKEKFGTLRFYMSKHTDDTISIADEATKQSATTCEVCGERGILRDERKWQFTLCDKHKNEWFRKGAGW